MFYRKVRRERLVGALSQEPNIQMAYFYFLLGGSFLLLFIAAKAFVLVSL